MKFIFAIAVAVLLAFPAAAQTTLPPANTQQITNMVDAAHCVTPGGLGDFWTYIGIPYVSTHGGGGSGWTPNALQTNNINNALTNNYSDIALFGDISAHWIYANSVLEVDTIQSLQGNSLLSVSYDSGLNYCTNYFGGLFASQESPGAYFWNLFFINEAMKLNSTGLTLNHGVYSGDGSGLKNVIAIDSPHATNADFVNGVLTNSISGSAASATVVTTATLTNSIYATNILNPPWLTSAGSNYLVRLTVTNILPGGVTNAVPVSLTTNAQGGITASFVDDDSSQLGTNGTAASAKTLVTGATVTNVTIVSGNIAGTTNYSATNLVGTLSLAQLPAVVATNSLSKQLAVTGTNVTIDLSPYTNSAQLSFYVTATTNLFFNLVTNAPAGLQFSIEIIQGTTLTNTVSFNTNQSAVASCWVPPVTGQFLTLPTNSILCRQVISAQVGSSGTNVYFNQLNFVR